MTIAAVRTAVKREALSFGCKGKERVFAKHIRAYAIYFSRIVAAPRYEAVRGLVAARHLVLASTLTHPGRCVIYCAFVLQTLGSCVCASESFRFRFRIPASPVKQASTFTSCTFQDQLFSSCSVMPSAVCCSSRSHANERKRL